MPDDLTPTGLPVPVNGQLSARPRPQPLPPLTPEQQDLVRRHIGLVGVHLRWWVPTPGQPRREREHHELFQEGCLALVRAAARYDPCRDGPFAPFALPRIRGAIHRAIYNLFTLIHVPARARLELRRNPADSRRPPLHVMDINDELEQDMAVEHRSSEPLETIRHAIRRRYELTVDRVLDQLRRHRWRQRNPCEVMACLAEHRLLIRVGRHRTPLRQIARQFNLSPGRVSAYERRLEQEVKKAFRADPQARALLQMAREARSGRDAVMDDERRARLREAEVTAFQDRFVRMPPPERAATLYALLERSTDCLPEIARNLFDLSLGEGEPRRTVA